MVLAILGSKRSLGHVSDMTATCQFSPKFSHVLSHLFSQNQSTKDMLSPFKSHQHPSGKLSQCWHVSAEGSSCPDLCRCRWQIWEQCAWKSLVAAKKTPCGRHNEESLGPTVSETSIRRNEDEVDGKWQQACFMSACHIWPIWLGQQLALKKSSLNSNWIQLYAVRGKGWRN